MCWKALKMREVTVAATQFANQVWAEALVRQGAGQGAQMVLMQDLFAPPQFSAAPSDRGLSTLRCHSKTTGWRRGTGGVPACCPKVGGGFTPCSDRRHI